MGLLIERNPAAAAGRRHDLIVVGGGIYGTALVHEATCRGLRPLLLEREDFGGRTSWNSLRIVHGGLRYLQSLDLRRFFESVAERRWFLRSFPELVRPLPCVMPLYGEGLRRRSVLAAALRLNDLLSAARNRGTRPDRGIPSGRLLSTGEIASMFPPVDRRGLRGAALWYDAVMPDSQRLLIEMLRRACARGAVALNYVDATALRGGPDGVTGLLARDLETGSDIELAAPVVVNCAGPWVRQTAGRLDRDVPALFRPSVALNLLLDREPPFATAVAVAPRRRGGRVYFLYPLKGKVFAGTFHAPCERMRADEPPGEALIRAFLDDLAEALPDFPFRTDHVLRVHWGYLPVDRTGTVSLATRPTIHDHARHGGPRGLFSVSGVKFTTARRVAAATLDRITATGALPRRDPVAQAPAPPRDVPDATVVRRMLDEDASAVRGIVRSIASEEAVRQPDDLLLRRTDWGLLPADARALGPAVTRMLP